MKGLRTSWGKNNHSINTVSVKRIYRFFVVNNKESIALSLSLKLVASRFCAADKSKEKGNEGPGDKKRTIAGILPSSGQSTLNSRD